MNVPTDIYNAINPLAQQQGVPSWLWEDVASVESGFNPQAVGDNGTSWGIFQLHQGGQADAAFAQGYSVANLYNPATNAQFALPAIASAWNRLKSTFSNNMSWWTQFAAASGHPGGGPGDTATTNEAAKLMQVYSSGPPANNCPWTCNIPTGITGWTVAVPGTDCSGCNNTTDVAPLNKVAQGVANPNSVIDQGTGLGQLMALGQDFTWLQQNYMRLLVALVAIGLLVAGIAVAGSGE